jgi:superfamily II DNA/RNA helicase
MTKNKEYIDSALANLGIEQLNDMQREAVEVIGGGGNVVLLSPTGSGKTLAFLLPLLSLLRSNVNAPDGNGNGKGSGKGNATGSVQALVLAPSRELALQINTVFRSMSTPWSSCCCYGGHPIAEEKKTILGSRPALIIGTPGRIADHLRKGNIEVDNIGTLIIDEFDKSLELGFQEEMAEIVEQLPSLRRRILLSATDSEEIPQFVGAAGATRIDYLDRSGSTTERLRLMEVISPEKDKIDTLYKLLCTLGGSSAIVFCNHRDAVDRVQKLLSERRLETEKFHGGMEQPQRERALYKFRNGSAYTLICTDLAARGLDVPEIEHVVHYHLPVNEEAFTHRNGRTARWSSTGASYIILNESERLPGYVGEIERFELPGQVARPPKSKWVTLYIGKGKKDKLSRMDIAGFFYKKGSLSRDDVGAIDVKEHYAFVAVRRAVVKQLLTLIRGEKIKGMKTIIEELRS